MVARVELWCIFALLTNTYNTMTIIDIKEEYGLLSDKRKITVLWLALEYMESYNGRSKMQCIAMAMGYENNTGAINDWQKASA